MSMQFTLAATGRVRFDGVETTEGIDADDAIRAEVGYDSSIQYEDAEVVDARIVIEARVRMDDIEVEAADMEDFDADETLNEAIGSYNATVSDAEFTIEGSPTGFEQVEAVIGREYALEAYVALANAGFEVN